MAPGRSRWMWIGLVMIVAGVAGLGHRTFTFTEHTTQATVGSVELVTTEDHRIRVPFSVGIGLIVIGSALLFRGTRA